MQFFSAKYESDFKLAHVQKSFNNLKSSEQDKLPISSIEEISNMYLKSEIKSENLQNCYNSYKFLLSQDLKGAILGAHLKNNDIEVWMSGLLCGVNENCIDEIPFFVPDYCRDRPTPVYLKKDTDPLYKKLLFDKDCPPGCGCDNPWAFLS